jgi:hypothetical protein
MPRCVRRHAGAGIAALLLLLASCTPRCATAAPPPSSPVTAPAVPSSAAASACGPGGAAPGGGEPFACSSTSPELARAGLRLLYTLTPPGGGNNGTTPEGSLRVALTTPGRGWVSLAWTRARDAGSSASPRVKRAMRASMLCSCACVHKLTLDDAFFFCARGRAVAPAHAFVGHMLPDGSGEVRSMALLPALYGGDVLSGTAPLLLSSDAPVAADASVVRDGSGTTLRFTRRLGGAGLPAAAVPVEVAASSADASKVPEEATLNHLNWAYGSSDELGYHGANRGSFTQELVAPPSAAAPAAAAPATRPSLPPARDRVSRAKHAALPPPSRLRTHGRLMLIAWAGLLPAGAAMGRFVQLPGTHGVPLRIHIALQIAGAVVATISFALIVAGARACVRACRHWMRSTLSCARGRCLTHAAVRCDAMRMR